MNYSIISRNKKIIDYVLKWARSFSRVGTTLQKAKRRMEDQLNKIGFGKSKKKESMEETPGNCKSGFIFLHFTRNFFFLFNIAR